MSPIKHSENKVVRAYWDASSASDWKFHTLVAEIRIN
jgi:hypothetical protein